MPSGRNGVLRPWRLVALALAASGCAPAVTTPDPTAAPLEPPEIEFVGLVTDVRISEDHVEFTDAAGEVHLVDPDAYRDVNGNGWGGPLQVLGRDAEGRFVASFPTQEGLPPDCYRENAVGVDRGSHVEINGVLWRKAPGFDGSIAFGTRYATGARFCFDELGRVASVIGR
jgi:hypothetical protein